MSKVIEFGVVLVGLVMSVVVVVLGITKATTIEVNVAILSVSLLLIALAVLMQARKQSG